MPNSIELSVVIPVFQSGDCLVELNARLLKTLESITPHHEVIYVDDHSDWKTWGQIQALGRTTSQVRGIKLSRNFGQHAAITAGVHESRGARIAVMDGDLQDPPEALAQFYKESQAGADIVFGKRSGRSRSFLKQIFSRIYFKLLSVFSDLPLQGDFGTYSLMTRPVAEEFKKLKDLNRHYLLMLYWLGFRTSVVTYEQEVRPHGKSSYTLHRLFSHAFQGIFFQSTTLLRWVVLFGFLLAAFGFLAAFVLVYLKLTGTFLAGWTSLIVVMLITSGFIILSVGMVGCYVGEVFKQVKDRPLYLVAERTDVKDSEL